MAEDNMKSTVSEAANRWQKIAEGDTRAFAEFVDQYKNLVTSIAYSCIGDLPSSEDVAQEAFLVAWQSRHELSDPSKAVSWLSSIARNLAKQCVRKRSAKSWASADLDSTYMTHEEPHPSERLVTDEEQQLVWGALEGIPEAYREVMILYYRESHSISEVALALEISEDAARQRLSRGRNLLRAEVERTIEAALVNSRPSVHFTAGVVSLVAMSSSTTLGKTVTTAAATVVGKTAVQSGVMAATQTATAGAMIGAAGGLLGALGGLGGTWLGIRVPQLMAPTMTERKLLEKEGRIVWRVSLCLVFASIMSVVVALLFANRPNAVLFAVLGNVLMGLCFAIFCVVRGIHMNRKIKHVRQTIRPEDDPNPTWLKDRMATGIGKASATGRWIGRRMTSQTRLLGWPLYDFQVADPGDNQPRSEPFHAKGWLAVGDKATGFLAIGNYARGIIALGGRSLGVFALGGLAFGLFSFGGLSIGLLSIGGLAIGHSAIGGGAVGWQAVGGGAVGIYSANGGLAVANDIAEGGLAISRKYAVGGEARAPESNTEEARLQCSKSWASAHLNSQTIAKNPNEFRRKAMIYGTVLPVSFSVAFALIIPMLMYRRKSATDPELPSQD